ncbi:hypothetical protein OG618_27425 [Kitasatospora sp. NBC_01246]|uniref:hypothetical protein n=1 Tax=Kitasatospora sp. NBC_01246 TaxID=2903570 RepID=UPI002E354317|nr:hypothetical protein [Kitasatospora sp. NBC_01246]
MTTHCSASVGGLLLTANRLLDGELAGVTTTGRHRGACLALRTALELCVDLTLQVALPGLRHPTSGRAKLLLLHSSTAAETARRVKALWAQLSLGCHYHLYELGPTYDQVRAWRAEVDYLVRELSHRSGS